MSKKQHKTKKSKIAPIIVEEFKKGPNGQLDIQQMTKAALEETDIDLIGDVCNWMKQAGISEERIEVLRDNYMIKSARFKSTLAQVIALNNFFHVNLRHLGTHAYYARSALQVFDKASKWEKVFKELVIPYLVDVNAPILNGEKVQIPEVSWEEKLLSTEETNKESQNQPNQTQTTPTTQTTQEV